MPGEPPQDAKSARLTRDDVRDQWRAVALNWGRWEPYFASSSWPVTQRLMAALRLAPGARILDFGCGIGDPALQIAHAVAPDGHVTAVDLAPEMVEIAALRAGALDLDNVSFRAAALEDVEPAAGGFDAVVGRFSLMFLVDIAAGLRRIRVLTRPGGRVAFSVWARLEANPMFAIPREQLAAVTDLPPVPADAPGPMRLSEPGQLEAALRDAGFDGISAADVRMYNFARDPAEYCDLVYALSWAFRKALDALDEGRRKEVRNGIEHAVAQYADASGVRVPALARVVSAVRPAD